MWSAAVVLIVFGLLTIWLPIPTGVPLIAGGAFLILGTSRQAVRWLRARRRRNFDLNRLISGLEDRAPATVAQVLRRSRPRGSARSRTPAATPETGSGVFQEHDLAVADAAAVEKLKTLRHGDLGAGVLFQHQQRTGRKPAAGPR
jgi:hypothetical protein